ncbi:hypothetical protein LINPERPRIM_LOCUS33923, partial [Linum perenne]
VQAFKPSNPSRTTARVRSESPDSISLKSHSCIESATMHIGSDLIKHPCFTPTPLCKGALQEQMP